MKSVKLKLIRYKRNNFSNCQFKCTDFYILLYNMVYTCNSNKNPANKIHPIRNRNSQRYLTSLLL